MKQLLETEISPALRDAVHVLGASGHAREIVNLLSILGIRSGRLIEKGREGSLFRGDRVAIGVGHPAIRLKLFTQYEHQLEFQSLVHPSTELAKSSRIGKGSVVCRGVVVSTDTLISPACLLNWNCTVGHDCEVGTGSVVNPSAAVSGGVKIGRGVLIGAGAVVLEGIKIGEQAVVGAGAVVTQDVAAHEVVTGIPARPTNWRNVL